MSEPEKSVAPILAVQKLFGMFPVKSSYKLDVGLLATNFLLIQITLITALVFKSIAVIKDGGGRWSSLAEFATVCTVSSVCILWVTHNRQHISEYVNECRKTHERFVSLQFRPKYPKRKNLAEIQIFLLLTVPLLASDIVIYGYDLMRDTYLVAFNLADAITFLEILLFAHLVAISKAHLNLINRFLKVKKVNILWGKNREIFEELTKVFHEVHGNCKNLNAAFSGPLLALTAMTFICTLIETYHAFSSLTESLRRYDAELPVLKFVSKVTWASYQMYKIYMLVEACSSLQDEATSFSVELREILASADHTQIVDTEELIRSHHLLYKKVDFTAADFYQVDSSLLVSIVAAVGSYLVILIQFGAARPASNADTSTTSAPVSTIQTDIASSTTPLHTE